MAKKAKKPGPVEAPRAASPAGSTATSTGSSASASSGRRLPLWAIGVLVAQLGLMLLAFNPAAHNGGDTAGYVTLAHSILDRGTYQDLWQPGQPPHTKYPPVFPAILAALVALGARTWTALKLAPLAFTTLSVMAAYLWARERRGAPFGAAVALLTAASNAFLWASHWELSDPPFVAFTFLALWAFDRAAGAGARAGDDAPSDSRWLWIAGLATGLAYFTREAGLPLLVAAVAWLLLRRRFRAAAVTGGAIGLVALLWSLRDNQGAQYMSEFWMIDPYQPDLGRVSIGGLIGRVVENTVGYVARWVPMGFTGLPRGGAVALIGTVLFGLAVWGWARRLRSPSVAELFVPMYLGLILLWPQVWSGDRFALPLFPLLLYYAGEVLVDRVARLAPLARRAALAAAILVLAVPALASWQREVRFSSQCAAAVASGGSFACWGPRTGEFVAAALWSGAHLPDSAIVLARKPRIFYVESGLASETFPFTKDSDRFLAFADSIGARYVLMDYIDDAATVYVTQALIDKGGSFCVLQAFGGQQQGPPTQLFGILPREARTVVAPTEENGEVTVQMTQCPAEMTRQPALAERSARTEQIPLLVGFE